MDRTRNILVIGGSYFVGRVCVETLASDPDNRITVVNRGNRPMGQPGVTEIVCDRHDYRLKEALAAVKMAGGHRFLRLYAPGCGSAHAGGAQ